MHSFRLRTLAVLAALAGCADDEPCPRAQPCDIRESSCQERATQVAACLRGKEAPSLSVSVDVVDADAYIAAAAEHERERPREKRELTAFRKGLSLLGLSSTPADVGSDLRARYDRAGAFYDPKERRITVLNRGYALDDEGSFALLVHEMVHALQHQEGAFAAEAAAGTYDQWLARRAVIEGDATLTEMRATIQMRGWEESQVDWERWLGEYRGWADGAARDSDDPFRDVTIGFVHAWGATYVYQAHRAGGHAAVAALLRDAPPDSTRQVMHPYGSAAPGGEAWKSWSSEPRSIGVASLAAPWRLSSVSHLGAWFLRELSARQALDDFSEFVRGDALTVLEADVPHSRPALGLYWRIDLDDEARARAVARDLVRRMGPNGAGADGRSVWLALRPRPEIETPHGPSWVSQSSGDLHFPDAARAAAHARPAFGCPLPRTRPPPRPTSR